VESSSSSICDELTDWCRDRRLYAVTDLGDGDAFDASRVHGEGSEVHRQGIHADRETTQYVLLSVCLSTDN